MHLSAFLPLLLAHFLSVAAQLPACPDRSNATFDFVVVGAGAGGGPVAARLAESGFSVLVVEAGHDVQNVNTTIPLYFFRATEDPQIELNYTLDDYPPGFRVQKNDVWYPRAQGLGGSTLHNAVINIIAETKTDFDTLASTFNDSTWSRDNMQEYFKKIERNLYTILPDTVNHGYDGWLSTNVNPILSLLNPKFLDLETVAFAATLAASGLPLIPDLNNLDADRALGGTLPSFTATEEHLRSTVRDRLVAVESASPTGLQFILDSIVTKVLLCDDGSGGPPTAYGVRVARGAKLAVAMGFEGAGDLETEDILVGREVIVAGGVFQSPQLLMLSGIGPADHLAEFGIESVVDLPGVGSNLQDHDEIAVIWRMTSNFSLWQGCTMGPDRDSDPCLAFWEDNDHLNLYSFGGAFEAILSQSEGSPEPDILTYWAPAFFRGFVRDLTTELLNNKDTVTAINLKAHPSSRGTVRLTGAHPQDTLDIQKNHFQSPDGPSDVADIREAIKRARLVMESLTIFLFVEEEIFPGPQASTDEEIEDHVFNNVFGHHACCTCAIGGDDDPNAVLDGNFKVRGVNGLRVVDASSWPNVPGYFVTTPTYMISEKAADAILADNPKS